MFSVVKGNYKDVTKSDTAKKYAAAQKIIDGNTTFLSTLVKGCSTGDKGSTLITGDIKATGTFTLVNEIADTRISLAMPGSKWSDKYLQSNTYTETNGKVVPAYPTYNERLGTFALLETPEIIAYEKQLFDGYSFVRLKLIHALKYSFNPKMNIDKQNTKIYCRLVSKVNSFITPNTSCCPYNFERINLETDNSNDYKAYTPFVEIDYFEDFQSQFVIGSNLNLADLDNFMIQFKILFTSLDIGTGSEKNTSYLIYTYPLKFTHEILPYNTEFQTPIYPLLQDGATYDNDNVFGYDEIISHDEVVYISAKLSTTNGAKVIIYSSKGFEIEPGAEISPDIELIIGYPYTYKPQPEQTASEINSFCTNNNKYKAQTFSASAIAAEEEAYRHYQELEKEKELVNNFHVYPSPASEHINIRFNFSLEASGMMHIADMAGKVVLSQALYAGSREFTVPVQHLSQGLYLVIVENNGIRSTRKVLKE